MKLDKISFLTFLKRLREIDKLAKGEKGDVGPRGFNGANGTNGADGAVGAQGPAGAAGANGADGAAGAQGLQGNQGLQGIQGVPGADGDAADIAAETHAAGAETILDADEMGFWKATNSLWKKITFANLKAVLKTYFDSLYAAALGADDNYVTDTEKANLAILATGNTTEKAINTMSKARAYLTAAQDNLTNEVWTKILLDTEEYDIGADFDTANSRFTTPIAGYYLVIGTCSFKNSVVSKGHAAGIYYDNALYRYGLMLSADTSPLVQVMCIVKAAAGKTIELYANQASGTNTTDMINGAVYATGLEVHLLNV